MSYRESNGFIIDASLYRRGMDISEAREAHLETLRRDAPWRERRATGAPQRRAERRSWAIPAGYIIAVALVASAALVWALAA